MEQRKQKIPTLSESSGYRVKKRVKSQNEVHEEG